MKSLYQDILLDHYRNPRNTGVISDANFSSGQYNPSCGDGVTVTGKVDSDGILVDVSFQSVGCVISVATASLLSEKIKGLSVADSANITTQDVLDLIGMELGPTRLKCALLPLYALREGLSASLGQD